MKERSSMVAGTTYGALLNHQLISGSSGIAITTPSNISLPFVMVLHLTTTLLQSDGFSPSQLWLKIRVLTGPKSSKSELPKTSTVDLGNFLIHQFNSYEEVNRKVHEKMNSWIQLIARISSTIPLIIMGVEAIHQGASGADKKTIALQALGLSTAVASAIAPSQQASIDAATQFASNMIDATVATYNQFGVFKGLIAAGNSGMVPVANPPSSTPGVTTLQVPK